MSMNIREIFVQFIIILISFILSIFAIILCRTVTIWMMTPGDIGWKGLFLLELIIFFIRFLRSMNDVNK